MCHVIPEGSDRMSGPSGEFGDETLTVQRVDLLEKAAGIYPVILGRSIIVDSHLIFPCADGERVAASAGDPSRYCGRRPLSIIAVF